MYTLLLQILTFEQIIFYPDGVNSTYTIKESNEMANGQNYYEYIVLPAFAGKAREMVIRN